MIRNFVTAMIALVAVPTLAFAVTDEFTITQQIGGDTNPPTVPTNVVATPVASTQIDLTWVASTDAESAVAGYQVFRNNVQIATTSGTTYNDIGLTASTTYDYNVSAYDLFFNISARSATTSTTTLSVPATTTPTSTPSDGGGSNVTLQPVRLVISGVQTEVTETTAVISFDTSSYALANVRFGLSPQYELGSLASDVYRKKHIFNLTTLESGRRYYFEVSAQNQRGDKVTYQDSFVTQSLTGTVSPENVSMFRAVAVGNDVRLSWVNPRGNTFDRVRIIANSNFYPNDIADGLIVYEGRGESYQQENVYPNNDRMYYAAFVLDTAGNVSSGALAQVSWFIDTAPTPTTPVTPTTTATEIDFNDLEFIQNSKIRSGYQSRIDLNPNQPFTVRLPYAAVPENLKTITITLTDPNDASLTFAFLLRINQAKTYYEATIGALRRQGIYPLQFSFFDFKTKEIARFAGTISTISQSTQTYPEPKPTLVEHLLFIASRYWWMWLLVLILLFMAYRLMTEEKYSRQNENQHR